MKKTVEIEVIKALQEKEYTLNTVNSYGENLLHISAANGCLNIVKEILQKPDCCQIIDRKNKFGWTPLMLAIRNRNIDTVKYLLKKNANVNESTYLGMSVLGLAAAINKEMFETVHEACPSALLNSINDDITPLCIAAMKNDKNLFFRLIELGFDISKSNEYTYIMMKQSVIPEIKSLVKQHFDVENYWNDTSDNILVEDKSNEEYNLSVSKSININQKKHFIEIMHNIPNSNKNENNNNNNIFFSNVSNTPVFTFSTVKSDECNNIITTNSEKLFKPNTLNLMINQLEDAQLNLISPTLTNALTEILPTSPSIYFTQNKCTYKQNANVIHNTEDTKIILYENEFLTSSKNKNNLIQLPLQRLQSIRPTDLNIQNDDLDATLEYIPQFSPLRSPNVPLDISNENIFGEKTPTPPRYKTPPRGMILNSEETKMFILLKHYGLSQHVPLFLEQEVDIDLFITLTNEDLIEIGIENEADRKTILKAVIDYKKSMI